jgi:hypothetical protein
MLFRTCLALLVCAFPLGSMGQGAKKAPATAPETSEALLARMQEKLGAFTCAKGVLEGRTKTGPAQIKFSLMRPNFLTVVGKDYELHGNGSAFYYYSPTDNTYMQGPSSGMPPDFLSSVLIGLEPVIGLDRMLDPAGNVKTTDFQGKKVLAMELSGRELVVDLYLDPVSLKPLGFKNMTNGSVSVYKELVLGNAMKPKDFAWSPPKGAKPGKA